MDPDASRLQACYSEFYERKNITEDRYILLKPAAGDMAMKIQETYLLPHLYIYLCVFNFTFKNISIL